MKALLAVLLLAGCASAALAPEDSVLTKFRTAVRAEAIARGDKPEDWIVKDTGKKLDLGEGEGPVVEFYRRDLPHSCLAAVAPDGERVALIECFDRAPETGL